MKKSDLKSGMIVEFRDGKLGIVMNIEGNALVISRTFCVSTECFDDDLTGAKYMSENYDVMKIWYSGNNNWRGIMAVMQGNCEWFAMADDLIWERDYEPQELTVAQFEALLGYESRLLKNSSFRYLH